MKKKFFGKYLRSKVMTVRILSSQDYKRNFQLLSIVIKFSVGNFQIIFPNNFTLLGFKKIANKNDETNQWFSRVIHTGIRVG